MAITQNTYTGDNSTKKYTFTFPYIAESDIKVTLNGTPTPTTEYTLDTATREVVFNTAPGLGVDIRIYRDTDIDTLSATFFPGSAIKAEDLNSNYTQNNYAVQEIKNNTWDVDTETIKSNETWVSNDSQVATTAAIDAETAVNFDTLVQNSTPVGSSWRVGKTWLDPDADLTLSVWNGSAWLGIASGGTFTNQPKVVYVDATAGNDNNDGHRISRPKQTIRAAVDQINSDNDYGDGSIVVVAPGIYGEQLPISIEKNDVGIIGTSLRTCIIHPGIGITNATATVNNTEYRIRTVGTTDYTEIGAPDNNVGTVFTANGAGSGTGTVIDTAVESAYNVTTPEANELSVMFECDSGSYFQNLTLSGMKASGARGAAGSLYTDLTFGLPPNQGWNFAFRANANIKKSPYIQNCTNFSDSRINNVNFTPHTPGEGSAGDVTSSPTGGGILVDGSTPISSSPLRSMVCDSYTHTALDGPGIFVTNNGYVQATSSYAFFNHAHITCLNGGQANLAGSTTDFGRFALIASGKSPSPIFTATVNGAVIDGAETFTITAPVAAADWFGSATRPASNMIVQVNSIEYPILSVSANGSGWDVKVSRPNPSNRSLNDGVDGDINDGTNVNFYLRSMIASSGHTMEYVGSGTDYRALPSNATGTYPVGLLYFSCGVPQEIFQKTEIDNGKIWTATTDHNGKFTIGGNQTDDPIFEVDQQLGFVTIPEGSIAFNLLSDKTPQLGGNLDAQSNKITSLADPTDAQDAATKSYVDTQIAGIDELVEDTTPQLGGNLDVNGNTITSTSNGNVVIDPNGTGTVDVSSSRITSVTDPSGAQDAATKNYVDNFAIVTDTTPQLGGDLDANGNAIILDTGTAADPSLTFTGDLNTGIYSPGADEVAATVAGSEALRIDSSGRLLVGTSSSLGGYASKLQVASTSDDQVTFARYTTASSPGILALQRSGSGTIGTNASVQGGDNLFSINFLGADGTNYVNAASITAVVDGTPGANDMPGRLVFSTTADGASSPTERMRIDKDGNLSHICPTESFYLSTGLSPTGSNVLMAGFHSGTSITSLGTQCFQILNNGNVNNTNNSYGAISDIKLKENIVDAASQWSDIKALQVRKYNFKEGQTHTQIGLIAQEVELVSPGLVSEYPDRDEEGNDLGTVTKSVNYSVLYMKAVKALQEAMERIETLEAKVAALEAP